jgi:hypothetical protein
MNSLRNRSTPPLRPVIAEAASAVQGTSGGSSRQPDVRAAVDELLFRVACCASLRNSISRCRRWFGRRLRRTRRTP